MKGSLASHALPLMIGKGLSTAITIVTPFLLVRALTQEEFGLYKQIFLIFATLFQVIPFGFVPSLFYFLPNAREKRKSYVWNVQILIGLIAAVTCTLVIIFKEEIAVFLASDFLQGYIVETAIYTGVMVLSIALEIILIIDRRAQWSAVVSVISEITRSMGILMAVTLFHNFHLMMWSLISIAVFRVAALALYLARSASGDEANISRTDKKDFLRYALPFGGAIMLTVIQGSLDRYIVSGTVGAIGFAVYSVGMFQVPLVSIMQHALADVAIPTMARYRQEGLPEAILFTWQRAMIYLAMIFVPVCLILIILRREFIEILFTNLYRESIPIFMVGVFILPLSAMLEDAVLRVYDDTRVLLLITIVTCIVLLITLYPLLTAYGLVGAAISSVLALVVNRILFMWRSARLLNTPLIKFLPWQDYLKVIAISLISAVIAEIIRSTFNGSNAIMTFLVVSIAFSLVYLVLVMRSGLLPGKYKSLLAFYFKPPFLRTLVKG